MSDPEKQEKARELTEKALDSYVKGDTKTGDKLAEEAVRTDRKVVEEIVADMEEDADANHAPQVGDRSASPKK